ncbi:MAG: DUF4163 domain-containing protein [Clostridiales bacterium]|nr:DUF4163 domain-containing protein [Clostridiales bacterium]
MTKKKLLFLTMLAACILFVCIGFGRKKSADLESYSILTETYDLNDVHMKYPQIQGWKDEDKEREVNRLIRDTLIENQIESLPETYSAQRDLILNMEYKITMQSDEILSILYTGNSQFKTPCESNSYYFEVDTITIDLKNVKRMELNDFVNIDLNFIHKIRNSEKVTNEIIARGEDKEKYISYFLEETDDETIKRSLRKQNEHYKFCVTEDSMIIALDITHAGGDYLLAEISR